ncbi:TIR domain-containing protein [Crocosphaera chwakensis]|uniref:CD-NTase-associated protein 12/Pycsar effector protein TIR domain-containing protein n=1 Tax=Crocosphaera chwakensis CCY0110 TaxID=391612 RepID=A3INK0_9CHRO|nr:nucleotide-binding protein [Crocosphaera chwakensis]EAZ91898.1 hypothetical protein CY0110_29524 [Crocosphaera chwakensis CCY0110]
MKLKVFIGSSFEGLDVAYAAQKNLDHTGEVTVWNQGIFELSSNTLDDLVNSLDKFDFAIFVFSPDDISHIREQKYQAVRDNVIFELGLFIAKLGKRRCFILMPRGIKDFRLPSDLLGVTPATYDNSRQDNNLLAALGPACFDISKAINKLGSLQQEINIEKAEVITNQNVETQETKNNHISNVVKLKILRTIAKYFDGTLYDKKYFVSLRPPDIEVDYYSNMQSVVELDYYLDKLIEEGALEKNIYGLYITKKCRNFLVENKLI